MARKDLLPDVSPERPGPDVIFDSRRAIVRARRRAFLRDLGQVVLLLGVDYVFQNWPSTHIPFITREQSILAIAFLNAGVMTHVTASRIFPRWSARRIATTWSLPERARFFAHERGQQTH
jgi:hypothetical protein